MKIVRFVVKEDKRTGGAIKKTDISSLRDEEKKSLMRDLIDRGLKRAGYKPESSVTIEKK